jgi:hypothetical protein
MDKIIQIKLAYLYQSGFGFLCCIALMPFFQRTYRPVLSVRIQSVGGKTGRQRWERGMERGRT